MHNDTFCSIHAAVCTIFSLSFLSICLFTTHSLGPAFSLSLKMLFCFCVSVYLPLPLSLPILSKKSVSLPLTHLILPSLSPSLSVFHSFLCVSVFFTLPLPHSFSLKNFVYKYDKCFILFRGNALCVHILLYQTLHLLYSGMFFNPSEKKTVFYQDSNRRNLEKH